MGLNQAGQDVAKPGAAKIQDHHAAAAGRQETLEFFQR